MARIDELNKKKRIENWKVRTGNMVWKGSHKDSRTKSAERHMARKPYGKIT